MEEILKFENRQSLFQFLIEDFGFQIIEEKYCPDNFGNFSIVLDGRDLLLRYYNDKSFLSIEISSSYENKWYNLSFIKDLIYNPDNINAKTEKKDNAIRIEELNSFLYNNLNKIKELFNKTNYQNMKKAIEDGLRKQFYLKYPSAKA